MRLIVTSLILLLCASCATGNDTTPRTQQHAEAMPAQLRDLLRDGKVSRARFYLDAQGRVAKVALYVSAAELPGWVIPLADAKIGAGQNDTYEVEHYADLGLAYEVTREVNGSRKEISFGADQRVLYTEEAVERDALPQAVRDQIAQLEASGATFKRSVKKTTDGVVSLHVRMTQGDREHRLTFDEAGALRERGLDIPAHVLITTSP